jgi:hypothetical protein
VIDEYRHQASRCWKGSAAEDGATAEIGLYVGEIGNVGGDL